LKYGPCFVLIHIKWVVVNTFCWSQRWTICYWLENIKTSQVKSSWNIW